MGSIDAINGLWGILSETHRRLKQSNHSSESLTDQKIMWAQAVLNRLNVEQEVIGTPTDEKGTLFVGNHISYLDIPLIMSTVKDISFVAKQELSHWPIFGAGAEKLGTVFVKRENSESRQLARDTVSVALQEGKRVILFPSGTTSIDEKKPWRKGAFEIAFSQKSWVQPFRLSYSPLREVAFIDEDFFISHLYRLFDHKVIKARIEFHTPVMITDPLRDCLYWNHWSQQAPSFMG